MRLHGYVVKEIIFECHEFEGVCVCVCPGTGVAVRIYQWQHESLNRKFFPHRRDFQAQDGRHQRDRGRLSDGDIEVERRPPRRVKEMGGNEERADRERGGRERMPHGGRRREGRRRSSDGDIEVERNPRRLEEEGRVRRRGRGGEEGPRAGGGRWEEDRSHQREARRPQDSQDHKSQFV